ncbi:MAG: hypothetical protein ACYDAG_15340 [Chloroflexota bacterium]
MATIVLHNGHLNVDRNPDPALHGSTGAPGELDWIVRFQDRLQGRLEAAGHAVKRTDGSGPNQDFAGDVFLADHYDGGAPESSHCMAAHAANDTTPAESERLLRCFQATYPAAAGIPLRQDLVTVDMTGYYGFAYEAQPDLIVEHGNGSNAHDSAILHGQLDLVVDATFHFLEAYLAGPAGPSGAAIGDPSGAAIGDPSGAATGDPSGAATGDPSGAARPGSRGRGSAAGSAALAASAPRGTENASAPARPVFHYVLWADGFQFRLPQAQAYLDRFKASNGWSTDDAALAQHVSIVGPDHLLLDVEQRLRAAGAHVERIAGDDTAALFAGLLGRDSRFLAATPGAA